MSATFSLALASVVLAIAITTVMDASGYTLFSALPLLPLTLLFWSLARLSRREIGLTGGTGAAYAWGLAYPASVLGSITLIALIAGAVDTAGTDWNEAILNIGLMSTTGVVMVMLTEEGFFRGWLWGALKRGGWPQTKVLVWTTIAFVVWHISAITLDTGFDVPAAEVPVYLINVTLLGAVWGLTRMISGSIVPAAVSHAVWNGLDYPLYGFGEEAGALGIEQTHIFGPEVGVLGIAFNAIFVAVFWRWCAKTARAATR